MTSTIITKNSSTASSVPSSGSLTQGELAVNVTDKKLYTKDSGGTVVKLVGGLGNQEANAAAITGGSINGTTVGASTASTGAFTTLAASGNVTLSGGTANGVAYLNGSKVVTSGSALTFDGQTLTNTRDTPILVLNDTAASNVALRMLSTGGLNYIQSGISGGAFAPVVFTANGGASEQMRLTTTGLGIGTSSPTAKLDVNGTTQSRGQIYGGTGSSTANIIASSNVANGGAGFSQFLFGNTSGDTRGYLSYSHATDTLLIGTAGSTRATLDSSGNLGLGVTPSAFTAGKAMEVAYAGNAMWGTGAGDFSMVANVKYNGALQYANTGVGANRFVATGGAYQWYNAPSGTAGNAITFTQAMTLDSSGRLGIGTTSPISGSGLTIGDDSSGSVTVKLAFSTSASERGSVSMNGSTGEMRLTSGYSGYGGLMAFYTNGAERARIDTSGNLLVGTTSAPYSANTIERSSGSYILSIGSSNNTPDYVNFYNQNGVVGSITRVAGTGVAYNITSDQRVKTNIVNAPEFGSVIDSIQVRSYDWKADGSHQRAGFIAQELVTVAPEAVHQPEDPDAMMAVDYSKLVPMLVKEIQSLRKRLADAGI